MTEQEYKDFKKALADAPEACTHHSNSSKRHFMIDGWRMHVWLGEVWSVPISNELDVLIVGDVRPLSDLRTMVEQYERIAELTSALSMALDACYDVDSHGIRHTNSSYVTALKCLEHKDNE